MQQLRGADNYVAWIRGSALVDREDALELSTLNRFPLSSLCALAATLYIGVRLHPWTPGAHLMSDVGRVLFVALHYGVRRAMWRVENHPALDEATFLRPVHLTLWAYHTHKRPDDARAWHTPIYVALPVAFVLMRILLAYAWHPWPAAFGFLTAFLFTEACHYLCHAPFIVPLPGVRKMREMHSMHHAEGGCCNFGVGPSLLLDYLLGTLCGTEPSAVCGIATVAEVDDERSDTSTQRDMSRQRMSPTAEQLLACDGVDWSSGGETSEEEPVPTQTTPKKEEKVDNVLATRKSHDFSKLSSIVMRVHGPPPKIRGDDAPPLVVASAADSEPEDEKEEVVPLKRRRRRRKRE